MPRHTVPNCIHNENLGLPVDVCRGCWPPQADDLAFATNLPVEICQSSLEEGDMTRGCKHPDYGKTVGSDDSFSCGICGEELTAKDN